VVTRLAPTIPEKTPPWGSPLKRRSKVQNRVFAVSIDSGKQNPYISVYRTDGTQTGGGMKTYTLTVDRLIRLLRAMVTTASAEKVTIYDRNGWVNWMLLGRLAAQILKLQKTLEAGNLV